MSESVKSKKSGAQYGRWETVGTHSWEQEFQLERIEGVHQSIAPESHCIVFTQDDLLTTYDMHLPANNIPPFFRSVASVV